MKNILVILLSLALAGCFGRGEEVKSVGDVGEVVDGVEAVKPVQIPALGGRLGEKAGPLPPLSGSDWESQQNDAVDADRQYNDVAHRFNSLIDVYNCVRDVVNNKKQDAIEACLNQ